MDYKYFATLFASVVISSCCVYLLALLFRRLKFFCNASGVPQAGGLAIGAVVCIGGLILSLSFAVSSGFYKALIPSGLLTLCAGLWDDKYEFAAAGKIVTQLVAAAILIALGVRTHIVFLNDLGNIIVTVIWVLLITNAFNLLDIMDGLCAAVTMSVAFGLLIVCIFNFDTQLSFLLAVLLGSIAGFLPFNLPPARLYLGNSGSHFLGFVLAAISMQMSFASISNQTALLSPVFIMGFPIFDTVFVSLMRLSNGRSALKKSRDHLALRFLKLGHSKLNALFFMTFGALSFVVSGVVLSQVSSRAGVFLIAVVMSGGFVLARVMSKVSIDG